MRLVCFFFLRDVCKEGILGRKVKLLDAKMDVYAYYVVFSTLNNEIP